MVEVQKRLVAQVALDPRAGGKDALYSYWVEPEVQVGDACFVPLGPRTALGFVVALDEPDEETLGFSLDSLKEISARIDGLRIPEVGIELAHCVAREYLCSLPVALTTGVPPGIRDRLTVTWSLNLQDAKEIQSVDLFGDVQTLREKTDEERATLTPMQKEILRTLKEAGGSIRETKTKKLPSATLRSLRLLKAKGLVEEKLEVMPFAERRKSEELLELTPDADKIEAFLHKEGKKKPAQALTLMRLQAAEHARLTALEIKALAGVTETTVKALQKIGLLVAVEESQQRLSTPPILNPHQKLAVDAICELMRQGEFRAFMLYGVTGSGKTEVYLRAASEALKQGRQVLYVVPEIALATQAIAQLRDRFGRGVTVLHSELSAGERLQNWLNIRNGEAPVVLGARSALFAPLDNVGLIVVDEEHEASYKQETSPRYHARSLALFLGEKHRCPVVLGSATPSVESFYEAEEERYTLLSLPERAASAKLPRVEIEDLAIGYTRGKPAILSENLTEKMQKTLDRGEQIILFLNRRAYAPFLLCRDCGHQMTCPNCAVSLTYHRRDVKLRCHHCGFSRTPPDICPNCEGMRISPFGVGTEKVEEAVQELFPEASVARLDRDVARKKGALEETLALFRSGETQILVGTQMVAKGLDFPNVTLVGVIAADVSLNLPDFRASERTYQLLSQVAGRAGRGQAPGQVVIQTFNPLHVAVQCSQTHEYLPFYERLKAERGAAQYPPFTRLVNILLTGGSRTELIQASNEVSDRLKAAEGEFEILGPTDCTIERIQNRWRRHLLLKFPPGARVGIVEEALLGYAPKGIQVVIDVDPYNVM